jgi:serine/threonine protein kinase
MPWYAESLTDRIMGPARADDLVADLEVGIALSEALQAIHRHGYAHRGVKPDNIFFDCDMLLLGDFGLCLWADDDMRLTESSEAVGSRYFIAPENEGGINESENQQPADFYVLGRSCSASSRVAAHCRASSSYGLRTGSRWSLVMTSLHVWIRFFRSCYIPTRDRGC